MIQISYDSVITVLVHGMPPVYKVKEWKKMGTHADEYIQSFRGDGGYWG